MIKRLFQEVKEDCKNIALWVRKTLYLIALRKYKRQADRLHKKYNCQFFVVKSQGKICLMSKHQFKYLRQTGRFKKQFTATELKKISIYYTPARYDKK